MEAMEAMESSRWSCSPRRALFPAAGSAPPHHHHQRAWRMSVHANQRKSKRQMNKFLKDLSTSPLSYDNHSLHGDSYDNFHDKVSEEYKQTGDFNADAESCSSSLQGLNFDSDSEYQNDSMDSPSMTKFQLIKENFNSSIMKTPVDGALQACVSPPRIPSRRHSHVREDSTVSPRDVESSRMRKRPYENVDSDENSRTKQFKPDAPKARLSLFNPGNDPENIPVKSFYDISGNAKMTSPSEVKYKRVVDRIDKHSHKKYGTKRMRKRSGEINFGVRHGIRKPKMNKQRLAISKENTLNMALDLIKNSPLNSYIDEFMKSKKLPVSSTASDTTPIPTNRRDISDEQLNKMDAILKQLGCKNAISEIYASEPTNDETDSQTVVQTQTQKNNKFFKSSAEQRKSIIKLSNMKIHVKNGKLFLPERKLKRSKVYSGKTSETMLQNDISILLGDNNEICDESEKNTIEILLKQWGEDDEPDVDPSHSGALKNIQDSQILLQHSNKSDTESDLQFIPIDGGYVLMEEDDIDDNSNLPGDLNSIESELAKLDKKIAELAKLNNMNPRVFIPSQDSDSASEEPVEMENLIYDEAEDSENDPNRCNVDKSPKLFPLFNRDLKHPNSELKRVNKIGDGSPSNKKFHSSGRDQYVIDAGQKKFGATQCKECGVIYQIGDALDEADHLTYHNASDILKFNGWKTERFCGQWGEARAIIVLPGDPAKHWQRVNNLLERVVHPQLGYASSLHPDKKYKVFLYISNKKIVGCLVAEMLEQANKMVTINGVDCCSDTSHPVRCGVSRIWTHKSYRRKGVATQLMNMMRVNFIFGHILSSDEIAFSSPTPMGKEFAVKYTGISDFYVYM